MRITLPSGTPAEVVHHDSPKMGLVIAPDIFGLRPLFDDMVADLAAKWQMSVIAVEPFGKTNLGPEVEPRFAAVPQLRDDDHFGDLNDAAGVLKTHVVGLLGFCLGGMYCFKSSRTERFERIVSFYGMITLPNDWKSNTQGEPLAMLINGYADNVLAIIGALDHYTPEADVAQLRATGSQVVVYPEAEHGFAHDPTRPSHRIQDANDAFSRTEKWLLSAL